MASGGMVFVGSPELVVVVDADSETTVRVDPAGGPWTAVMVAPQSAYRLTATAADGTTSTTPPPAELATTPPGWWAVNPFMRKLLDRPRPWRSWQAAVSAFLIFYATAQITFALSGHARPIGWAWTAFVTLGAVLLVASWISLYQARAKRRSPRPGR